MAKIIVAHKNTESTEIDLGELKNDKVAWMVLLKDDGSLQHFFPNRVDDFGHMTQLRDESYVNAKRIIDECTVEELQMLLNEIWDGNAQKWIDNSDMHDTIGYEFIMKHGFTRNQLKWIRHLIHIVQGRNAKDQHQG